MIERIWHGWTAPDDADEYERFLTGELFPEVAETVDGYRGGRVLRRSRDGEVEFVTAMRFESIEAVEGFAGEDYGEAHVPPTARDLLSRYDDRVRHFEVRAEFEP
ncbi:antibiotic biosynthesis monooxygenase family protein [Haloarcula litorea]|uniref:antibiotic biosynthesis monooxygenase family protein n=1 Tax=Haloarcula litorea TaxID=3032579 RepID=UPI0023E7DC88|nr:hypothetical protein [Halomicroarcula sp. GDY20]